MVGKVQQVVRLAPVSTFFSNYVTLSESRSPRKAPSLLLIDNTVRPHTARFAQSGPIKRSATRSPIVWAAFSRSGCSLLPVVDQQ